MEKLILEGPINHNGGWNYHIDINRFDPDISSENIGSLINEWIWSNVIFAGVESIKDYRITIEEIN